MKKRKSPKEIIESAENPQVEHLYMKFQGEEIKNISLKSKTWTVSENKRKKNEILEEHSKRKFHFPGWHPKNKYTEIHTHPYDEWGYYDSGLALPSKEDILRFLTQGSQVKTMVIAQTNRENGRVKGYFILRKNRNYKAVYNAESEMIRVIDKYENEVSRSWRDILEKNPKRELKKLCKKFNLKYKWVPAKGYELSDEKLGGKWSFVEKGTFRRKNLEKIIGVTMAVLFTIGIIAISSNITGYAIFNFEKTSSNLIGLILLFVGFLIGLIILRKNKKVEIKITKNKNLTKKQKEIINKGRKKEFGKDEAKNFSNDYEPETLWFFVKKKNKIVSLGGIRPIKIKYLGKTYQIGGICSIISLVKKKGYGKLLISSMIEHSIKTGKTILGFTRQTEFFKKAGLKTQKNFIKRFVWVKPNGERVYDNNGDGIYYDGKDKFISKVLKTKSPVFIFVEHW